MLASAVFSFHDGDVYIGFGGWALIILILVVASMFTDARKVFVMYPERQEEEEAE
jgi:hypothetical protein